MVEGEHGLVQIRIEIYRKVTTRTSKVTLVYDARENRALDATHSPHLGERPVEQVASDGIGSARRVRC